MEQHTAIIPRNLLSKNATGPRKRLESHPTECVCAPLKNPQYLLWELTLTNLSSVPQNVRFEIDDVESEWAYTKPFDYIHCRYMVASIHDWPQLVKNTYE